MSDFVHLHCHTEYSLLDGAIRLKELCARAKDYGMAACAVTDHGNLHGAARFYKHCKEFGLKPIIGCEVYVCRDHTDKTSEDARRNRHHLILLARTNTGYHNLVKLVTCGALDGFYYKPRVDKALLRRYAEGLICLSACISGEIPRAVISGDMDAALALTREYADIFPDFYLELQSNGLTAQEKANAGLLELAEKIGLPVVATNDCHYLDAADYEAHQLLLCVQRKTTLEEEQQKNSGGRKHGSLYDSRELYYKSAEEMEQAFSGLPPEALVNSARIAEQCDVELDLGRHHFPVYDLPEGSTAESELRRLAAEGLKTRLAAHPRRETIDADAYKARLERELEVILGQGYASYFLIVQEFINWAKEHGVPVGPGRGSAAGSLVAWALGITNIDPLPYNLLFERFLNSERVSLPDIDVDFCERRRAEVIRHMVEKYGADAVAQITTFGTMKARAVVRDVGRAMGMSYAETDQIAKLIPGELDITIEKALDKEPELRKLLQTDSRVEKLIRISQRLEGLSRHASTHAAGLVVSDKPTVEYLPLYRGQHNELVTQFDGPTVEEVGLVKFDFLGLKTMTLIDDTLRNIAAQGKTPPDMDNLALDDKDVYELYSRGDTDGIFQMESAGMRKYLRQLKPSCFEDIIAMCALYRPGPLGSGMVEDFIRRKQGQTSVVYPHELLRDCLKDTYGVIVYQEQVMQISQIIAGYTLGGADILRRAMGKKKPELMAGERIKFVAGAQEKNISKDKANEIFDLMAKFAEYGFNKSHSAAYALISYHTAWLKTHFSSEFMAALLTSETHNQEKLLKYISCCKDMNIDVRQPSVNASRGEFAVGEGAIVFGLGGIKGVGDEAIREIVEGREKGDYASLLDFCCRVNLRKVTKRVLEALIKSGACDCFKVSRAGMMAALDDVIGRAQKKNSEKNSNQVSMFSLIPAKEQEKRPGMGFDCPEADLSEWSDDERLKAEKESLGFFASGHPLQPYSNEIRRLNLTTLEQARELESGAEISCAVEVVAVKKKFTKKGDAMSIVNVDDTTGHAEVVFFPKAWDRARNEAMEGSLVCLSAIVRSSGGAAPLSTDENDEDRGSAQELKLEGLDCVALERYCAESSKPVCVYIPRHRLGREDMLALRNILQEYRGHVETIAAVDLDGYECRLSLDENLKVRPGPELEKALAAWAS
ncbi:MAG: DNA polymerase III subunit alpha [Desulfovibrio sp.]|jgi:DNA polymerase-3 subunit alpha|nr:DNA polymerase III subunit alpha [Desulfovibrio sp.]